MSLATYDPGQISIVFNDVTISGFMDGTFVSAEREVEDFTKHVGADGLVTRVQSRNRSGTVTLTLTMASPSNEALSAIKQRDEDFRTGVGTLQIKDLNGNTLLTAEKAWLQKWPSVAYGAEVEGREWMIDCAELQFYVGSSVTP